MATNHNKRVTEAMVNRLADFPPLPSAPEILRRIRDQGDAQTNARPFCPIADELLRTAGFHDELKQPRAWRRMLSKLRRVLAERLKKTQAWWSSGCAL